MPACSWGTLCLEPPWETCTCHVKAPALPVAEADQSLSCYNAQAAGCSTSADKRAFNLYMCQDLPFSKQVSPHGSPKLSPLDELAGLGWAWTVFHPSFLFSLNKETFLTKNLPKLVYLYHSDGSHTHTHPPPPCRMFRGRHWHSGTGTHVHLLRSGAHMNHLYLFTALDTVHETFGAGSINTSFASQNFWLPPPWKTRTLKKKTPGTVPDVKTTASHVPLRGPEKG